MKMTKHAYARFKQRQKIKNQDEMMRKFELAIKRGNVLSGASSQPGTICIVFGGYKYIVSEDKTTLITVFREKKTCDMSKKHLLDELLMKQCVAEVRLGYALI